MFDLPRVSDLKVRRALTLICLLSSLLLAPSAAGQGMVDLERRSDNSAPNERSALQRRLMQGAMARFRFRDSRLPLPDVDLGNSLAAPRHLSTWRGKAVLINFWATWCLPCREEMPSLARLQKHLGSADFEVVAVSIDKSAAEVDRFVRSLDLAGLTLARDAGARTLAAFEAVGVPSSILIDKQGREIGRLRGSADWASDEAILLIKAMMRDDPG